MERQQPPGTDGRSEYTMPPPGQACFLNKRCIHNVQAAAQSGVAEALIRSRRTDVRAVGIGVVVGDAHEKREGILPHVLTRYRPGFRVPALVPALDVECGFKIGEVGVFGAILDSHVEHGLDFIPGNLCKTGACDPFRSAVSFSMGMRSQSLVCGRLTPGKVLIGLILLINVAARMKAFSRRYRSIDCDPLTSEYCMSPRIAAGRLQDWLRCMLSSAYA